jgi:hypothetical protein
VFLSLNVSCQSEKEIFRVASEMKKERAEIRGNKIGPQFSWNGDKRQRTITKGKV